MNVEIAKGTFLDLLDEVSSVDQQIKLWLNIENETGLVSSFVEFMNNIDTGDFEYVVNNLIVDPSLKENLQRLLSMIDKYEEPKSYRKCKNDVYIVADPKWKEIRDFAKNLKNSHSDFFDALKSEA